MSCFLFRQWFRDLCRPLRYQMADNWIWIVTLAVLIQYFFLGGFMYNYCLLFIRLQKEFHCNATLTGWMGSLLMSLSCMSSPVSIFLINRRSPRAVATVGVLMCGFATLVSSYISDFFVLYITFSTIYGIGANFVYQSTTTLLLMDNRGETSFRSSAFTTIGTTLGIMILSPSLDHMMTHYGWRYCLRAVAVVILSLCLVFCVFLIQPDHEKLRRLREQLRRRAMIERALYPGQANGDYKRIEIKHSKDMRLFFSAYALTATAWTFYFINSVSYITSVGLETNIGALLVFVFAASTIFGKYFLYLANKYLPVSRIYLMFLSNLVSSIASLCFLFSRTVGQLVPLFLVLGMLMAVFQGIPYSAAVELFKDARASELSSLIMLGLGIGWMIGGPLAGGIYDMTGNYNATLLLVAVLYVLSSILYIAIPIRRTLHTRKQRQLEATVVANQATIPPRFPGCRCHLMIVGNEEQFSVFNSISTV